MPALGAIGVHGVVAHRAPALVMVRGIGAVPGTEDHVAGHLGLVSLRDGVGSGPGAAVGSGAQDPARGERGETFLEMLREHVLAPGQVVRLDGEHRGLLMVAMIALDGGRAHGDDDVGAGRAHHPDDAAEDLGAVPDVVGQGRRECVEEVDRVEVEDVLDARVAHGGALLGLADQAQLGALLEAHRVAAALAAGHGDHSGLLVRELVPLPEGREGPRLVIRVSTDVQDVEIDTAVGERPLHRREGRKVEDARSGGEAENGRALQQAPPAQRELRAPLGAPARSPVGVQSGGVEEEGCGRHGILVSHGRRDGAALGSGQCFPASERRAKVPWARRRPCTWWSGTMSSRKQYPSRV